MKKQNLFFLFAITLVLSLSLVNLTSASNPQHHLHVLERACAETNPTTISGIVCNNMDASAIGMIYPDWTVPKYFTEFVKYSNSHSPSLCQNLITRAGTDERLLAFAYNNCLHQGTVDSISHNIQVPPVIEKTKLTNEIIHALAEEAINDILLEQDPQLRSRLNQYLRGVDGDAYMEFLEFYEDALQQNELFQDENVGANVDFLMTQVIGSEARYEHGFGASFVVPVEIWVGLSAVFLISLFGLMMLVFKKNKGILTWISIVLILIPIAITSIAFYGLFSGNLFTIYQSISQPITKILPLGDYQSNIDLQVQSTIQFFNQGSSYMAQVDDPTGITALDKAGKSGLVFRWIIGLILMTGLGALVYFNFFFKRKKKKRNRQEEYIKITN